MATDRDDQRKARELLAAEYDRDGMPFVADCIRTDAMLSHVEERAIRAIVAALAQRAPQNGAVPEGWRWVPKLATGKMLAEARKRGRGLEECWQIMVDLAPDAPAPEAETLDESLKRTIREISDEITPEAERAKGEAVAWIRFCTDGTYEGPIHDSQMDDIRRKSDAWTPLVILPNAQPTAYANHAPPPAGQPEGVDDYERIYAEVIKVCADQPMAHEIASRLASAPQAVQTDSDGVLPALQVGSLPTLNQDEYPALGDWWVQLWAGDEVFARVYGPSPDDAHQRATEAARRLASAQRAGKDGA